MCLSRYILLRIFLLSEILLKDPFIKPRVRRFRVNNCLEPTKGAFVIKMDSKKLTKGMCRLKNDVDPIEIPGNRIVGGGQLGLLLIIVHVGNSGVVVYNF